MQSLRRPAAIDERWLEKEEAEAPAWSAPGVSRIVTRLVVTA